MSKPDNSPATKKSAEKPPTPKSQPAITEPAVADYLREHPNFFQRHRQLVCDLKIPHGERGSVSLVERQLEAQREQLRQLQGQLQQFVDNADANQSVYDRIGALAIAMARTESLEQLLQSLCDQLADNFAVDAVAIELPARDGDTWPAIVHTMVEPATDLDVLPDDLKIPYLGTPPAGLDLTLLFGDQSEQVASVAILPLSDPADHGRLLLASYDGERFRPDLGTSLLTQITDLFCALLSRHWSSQASPR